MKYLESSKLLFILYLNHSNNCTHSCDIFSKVPILLEKCLKQMSM